MFLGPFGPLSLLMSTCSAAVHCSRAVQPCVALRGVALLGEDLRCKAVGPFHEPMHEPLSDSARERSQATLHEGIAFSERGRTLLEGFLSFGLWGSSAQQLCVPRVLGKNEGAMGTNDAMLYIL